MLDKITLEMREDIPGRFDRMHVEIQARLIDGTECSARSDGPPGCWGAPPISDDDHLVKVRDCLGVRLGSVRAENVIADVQRFELLDSADVSKLMACLAAL